MKSSIVIGLFLALVTTSASASEYDKAVVTFVNGMSKVVYGSQRAVNQWLASLGTKEINDKKLLSELSEHIGSQVTDLTELRGGSIQSTMISIGSFGKHSAKKIHLATLTDDSGYRSAFISSFDASDCTDVKDLEWVSSVLSDGRCYSVREITPTEE